LLAGLVRFVREGGVYPWFLEDDLFTFEKFKNVFAPRSTLEVASPLEKVGLAL
jgi:hypothetical protein